MVCKRCNTRFETQSGICPHCGSVSGTFLPGSLNPMKEEPTVSAEPADELELEDLVDPEEPKPVATKPRREQPEGKVPPKPVAPAKPPAATKPGAPGKQSASVKAATPVFCLAPEELRALLAERPELLEEGLRVFTEKGKPVGVGYAAEDVGEIDILARDAGDAFVVVMVSERDPSDDIVGEVLQRMGWVRKHLTKGKQAVRGIVLLEKPPENLGYTAAAVGGAIAFKTYRVAVSFDDLEV